MTQRDRQRQRPQFHGTSWEPLEDRQLLSGAAANSMLASKVAASQARWQSILASHPGYAAHYAHILQNASSMTASQIRATSLSSGKVMIPENGPTFRGSRVATNRPAFVASGNAPTSIPFQAQPTLSGFSATGLGRRPGVPQQSSGFTMDRATPNSPGIVAPLPAGSLPVGAPTAPPVAPPNPLAGLHDVTLSLDDVAGLKTSVEAFAASYTSGKDQTKDAVAVAGLRTGLDGLSQSVWAESHVASKSSVAALQQAVNTFASQYTSGLSVSQDKAAWTTLQTAVATFGTGLKNPTSTATATTPAATTFPMHVPGGPMMGGPQMGRPDMGGPGMGEPGMGGLAGSLLNGPALSADEVGTLKTSVETFANAYTYGVNKATDTAATDALGTALGGIGQQHWQDFAALNADNPSAATATAPPTGASGGPGPGLLPVPTWQTYVTAPATATATATPVSKS